MHEIKTKNKQCSLCGSKDTNSKLVFNGKQYRVVTKCFNKKCISNMLNTHTPISSGNKQNDN